MAVIAVAVGTLLGGCQVALPGSAAISAADQLKADKRAERSAAVDGALTALGNQPVAVYHSTLNGTDLVLRITKSGTMLGSLPVDGQAVRIIDVDNQLYISASADFWKAHGSSAGDTFAKGWARADATDLALDPGSLLTPDGASHKLRSGLSTMDQLADPLSTKPADGTEVFEVGTGAGKLQVTTAQPYRVVSFAPALLETVLGKAFGDEFRLDPVTPDVVKKFHEDLDTAVGELGRPADSVAQASVSITDNKLDCNGGNGSCTATVQVENSLVGADMKASTIHLVMTSVVTADSLGTQTCTGEASATPNTSSTLVCTVKFKLPNRTAAYKVVSMPSATGDVLATVDPERLKQKLQSEFAALGS
jgi:hypothetical protein